MRAVVNMPEVQSRPARPTDVRLYFEWANDPQTRQQSFNAEPISWENHEAWFARKMADPNALLLVFDTDDNVPVGQVRFEKQANGEVIIGVSVDKDFRGRGLASVLIREACTDCRVKWGNVPVTAYIKPENVASVRAFGKAGFGGLHQSSKFGVESVCLTFR